MCAITRYLSTSARDQVGRPPKKNCVLQAFIAADLLLTSKYDVVTVTAAALCTDVPRPAVQAALTLLRSGDEKLIVDVLPAGPQRDRPPVRAPVLGRGELVQSFSEALTAFKGGHNEA